MSFTPARVVRPAFASMMACALVLAASAVPADGVSSFSKLPLAWSVNTSGWNRSSSPVIADIDGDGANEVVVGHEDGYLRAYEGNGALRWAAAAVPGVGSGCRAQSSGSAVASSPAVADIDGDGNAEVVVGVGSTWSPNQNGSVVAFEGSSGAIEWQWTGGRDMGNVWADTPNKDGWCEGVFSTPAIGDVNGDGGLDVVFAGWDFNIWAVDGVGNALPGFPYDNDDSVWSSPAVFDIDADGAFEILIGGDSTPGGNVDHLGGTFQALDLQGGTVVERWRRFPSEVIQSSPAIGDINGDGRVEAVVGSGEFWNVTCAAGYPCPAGGGSTNHTVWAWHVDDGSTVPGFPVNASGTVFAAPALGDIDGDGQLEVVVGSYDHGVYAWNGSGSLLWSTAPQFAHFGTRRVTGHPVIADLDGDGDQDVAIGSEAGIAFLDGRTGAQLDSDLASYDRAGFGWSYESAPAVGLINGARHIVFSGINTPDVTSRLAAHVLPGSNSTDAWPMYRHGADRTGSAFGGLCGAVVSSGPFCDVPDDKYFTAAISWMSAQGITTGVTPKLFAPYQLLDRGQMITMLWRQQGEPSGYPASGFSDVPAGRFYSDAVAWARATGVTTGTSPTHFSPGQVVSRAQLATLLWRRAGSPTGYPPSGFVDVPAGQYFSLAVDWAAATGVTTGTSPTTFDPHDPVSRAQAATLIHREAGSPPA